MVIATLLIPGILVVVAMLALMILAMLFSFISGTNDNENGLFGGVIAYFVFALGYIAGLGMVAIGIVQELT